MVHKHEHWIIGRRMTVVGLLVVAIFSLHCQATEGNRKDTRSPRARTETPEVSRRVIMMPVSVVGTPTSGEESAGPQVRVYTADETAVPVIPVGIDFVYPSGEDQGRPAGAIANTLDVTIPVTLIGAPRPGETGYLRKIHVFFVAGDEGMPRIPTEVRVVYASGEKPSLLSSESGSSRGDPVPASRCVWQRVDGAEQCVGTCEKGICALVTREIEGHQVTRCECIIIIPVPGTP